MTECRMADPLPDTDRASTVATAPESVGLPNAVPQAAAATAPAARAPRGESRTTRLYRAALGPVNTEHYLHVFGLFDAAGRRRLLWHPAAGLFTLGWLVFRRLWTEALVYGLLLAAVVGLCLWAWPVLQTWPTGVRWGVLVALLLCAVWLPGWLGHGLLHRQMQRRLLRAVSAARTMDEACAALARQAATRRRLWLVVSVHVTVLAALGLVWERGQRAVTAPVLATAPVGEVVATPPIPSPEPPVPQRPEEPAGPDAPVPPGRAEAAQTPPAAPGLAEPPLATVSAAAPYAINVGLFADAGNALRARQRLQQAGLPVLVQVIATRQGPRTRVRVGPYPQRPAAEEAAGRIRALGLEAVVLRQ